MELAFHQTLQFHRFGEGYDLLQELSRCYYTNSNSRTPGQRTSRTLEDGVSLSIRVTVIAHFRESQGVRSEQDAFVGPGVIILPSVVVGRGAVVTAGSVVTQSVPPKAVVQGNPAVPVAKCGIPLAPNVTVKQFSRRLKPLESPLQALKSASDPSMKTKI